MNQLGNELTLIINGHKDFESYVPLFIELLKDYEYNWMFIFDRKPGLEIIKILDEGNIKYYIGNNVGKLQNMLDYSHNIETKFVKNIDFDDSLSVHEMKNFVAELKDVSENSFVVHKGSIINPGNNHYGVQSVDENIIKEQLNSGIDPHWMLTPNAKAVYPVKYLKQISKYRLTRQNYFDDDFLDLIIRYLNKDDVHIIERMFYIQFNNLGQTSIVDQELLTQYITLVKNINLIVSDKGQPFDVVDEYELIEMFDKWAVRINNEDETLKKEFILAINSLYH